MRPAGFTETTDQHIVFRFQVEHKKVECSFSEFTQNLNQVCEFFSRPDIDNEDCPLHIVPGLLKSLHQFGNEGDRKVIDTEKTKVFKCL